MKKIIFIIGLIPAIMILWSCEDDFIDLNVQDDEQIDLTIQHDKQSFQKNELIIHKSKLQNRVFTSESLIDNVIGNSPIRKLQIYTPPGYEKHGDRVYPVIYLLHGLPFSEKAYIDIKTWDPWIGDPMPFQEYPDFPEEGFREWVDGLILAEIIEPLIIVMPNAANEMYGFSFYTNSLLNGNFENFIVEDVVSYIDENYRTINSPDSRSVMGNSQGGYAAIKLGMLHPDVFGVVASHSGLLYLDGVLALGEVVVSENPDGFIGPDPTKFLTSAGYAMSSAWSPNLNNPPFYVDLPFEYPSGAVIPEVRERWRAQDVFTMLDANIFNFSSLKGVYMDAGTYDELGMNQMTWAFKEKLDYLGIANTTEGFDGGHFNKMFSRFERSFAFCSELMN